MRKKFMVICTVVAAAVGLLIGAYSLGKNSVNVLNEQEIENAAKAKTNDVCQSIMHILNDDPDTLTMLTNLDPEEYKTKVTVFGPAETIYYTNYGGRIRVTTEKPAFER